MDIDLIFDKMKDDVINMKAIGSKVKLIVEDYIFVIDGTGAKNVVYQQEDMPEMTSTIITDKATFFKMKKGELNPMMGLMTGKIDIDGSMGLAFRMKGLLTSN